MLYEIRPLGTVQSPRGNDHRHYEADVTAQKLKPVVCEQPLGLFILKPELTYLTSGQERTTSIEIQRSLSKKV